MPSVDDFSTGSGKTLKVRACGSTGVVGQRWGTLDVSVARMEPAGLEPATSTVQGSRSSN